MKKTRSILVFVLSVIFLLSAAIPLVWADSVKLGVLAKRGKEKAVKKWKPLAEYLGKKTGENFMLLPLSFEAIEPAVKGSKVDYLIANPGFFVTMKKKYEAKALASMLNLRQGKALNQFGGVIFVKKDSPIKALADIKGKKFMCVKYTSFGGGQMAFRHFLDNSINPFKDFASMMEGKKHDNVVLSVARGIVQAGTVRSDTLERMEAEGKIKKADFRVIDKQEDGFPFVHSTVLYPEWPFAAMKHTSSDVNEKVLKALKGLEKASPAAFAAKIAGWTEPLDYTPVSKCLEIVERARH